MPSREEMAAWLRGAGKIDEALARMSVAGPASYEFAIPWNERAAQVEAMRCETCEHYELPYTESRTYDSIPDKCAKKQIRGQGKDFGCFNHEPKEG